MDKSLSIDVSPFNILDGLKVRSTHGLNDCVLVVEGKEHTATQHQGVLSVSGSRRNADAPHCTCTVTMVTEDGLGPGSSGITTSKPRLLLRVRGAG